MRQMVRAGGVAVLAIALSLLSGRLSTVEAFTQTAAGYVCEDSEEATGPAFSWDDISVSGTALPAGDDVSTNIPIGFTFTYMGAGFTTVNVCSNGFLQFGGANANFTNTDLPNAALPNNIICPFWDDLFPTAAGAYRYQTLGASPNQRLVVSWVNVPHFSSGTDSFTFQVTLFEGAANAIRIQYQTMTGTFANGNSATIGIEDAGGTAANRYHFNGAPAGNDIYNNLAVGFYIVGQTPPWGAPGPQPPTTLIQSAVPAGPPQAVGFTDADGVLSFRGTVTHSTPGTQVQLEVEIKDNGAMFNGAGMPYPLVQGNLVVSGGVSEVTAPGLPNGTYHWRARTITTAPPAQSAWVEFDPPAPADFGVLIAAVAGAGKDNANGSFGLNDKYCFGGAGAGATGGLLWAALAACALLAFVRR